MPHLNLVVIRSSDLRRAACFDEMTGLVFVEHTHGNGPIHLACECDGTVFEIYRQSATQPPTRSTRIGFAVDNVDAVADRLEALGVEIVSRPTDTEWGRRAVAKDFDGHRVELSHALPTLH